MTKILAIDYGSKNVGLALSDDEGKLAFAYNTLHGNGDIKRHKEKIAGDIKNICKLEKVDRVVVGMPLGLAGGKTEMSEEVFEFVKILEEGCEVPVEVEDERWTSVQASKMENKTARNIDELSAQILLQAYLDKIAKNS